MIRIITVFLALVAIFAIVTPAAIAGTDEFLGDSSIYSGVPTTVSKPNVLIIVDNSRSTEKTAGGQPFLPRIYDTDGTLIGDHVYPLGNEVSPQGAPTNTPCTDSSPARGCFDPWGIYILDNQGDFSSLLMTNTSSALSNLSCDPSSDSSQTIHKSFIEFGSYSGSASPSFPTLDSDGTCITSGINNSGDTYALGNYLNYTKTTAAVVTLPPVDPTIPAECTVPARVVSVSIDELYCNKNNPPANLADCTPAIKIETRTRTSYYQLNADNTHTSSDPSITPINTAYWTELSPSGSYPTATEWADLTLYTSPIDRLVTIEVDGVDEEVACGTLMDPPPVIDTSGLKTQREIIHNALEQVISATAGVVNFGAMVYGGNNSGAEIIEVGGVPVTHMQDLSVGLSGTGTVIAPDCDVVANANLAICKFIAALPGPGEADGAPRVSSNANRPLAESLFDAGNYFGADYTAVTNGRSIPPGIVNLCDLNHIILITNGFSNGDGSPKLSVIGDADGDGANEAVYGLGSHWLDDVAKYLRVNYEIKTHTVLAFQTADALIVNAAKDGEGQFYNVFSAEELSAALLKLLSNIVNESNTSFVAPVVPASTTNRTISSNKVYLGLFRPQQDSAWHGNIKKYGLSFQTNLLTDKDGNAATDIYGSFDRDSISYWSIASNNMIPTANNPSGYINPNLPTTDPDYANTDKGDGGQVDSGGAGGVLLERVKSLLTDIRTSGTWETTNSKWRKIYTYLDPSKEIYEVENRFVPWNATITSGTLDLRDDVSDTLLSPAETDKMILYTHGFDVEQTTIDPGNVGVRNWVLGDVLHSRPLVFNYSKYGDLVDGTCPPSDNTDIASANTWNSSVVYVGANDGMMHAFRDCDGDELWAYIPPDALDNLQLAKDPEETHASFIDSAPSVLVYDQNENGIIEGAGTTGGDRVVLLFGQRRGGGTDILDASSRGSYTALDVSNPYQPKLLWQLDSTTFGELGETWSQPRMAKVRVDDDNFKLVMFIGAGYDNNEDFRFGNTQTFPDTSGLSLNTDAVPGGEVDGSNGPEDSLGLLLETRNAPRGRGIVALEIAEYSRDSAVDPFVPTLSNGTVFWSYTNSSTTSTDQYNAELKYSFPTDLNVVDADSNGFADTIYAGDTGGNLWRFDISNASETQWSGEIIFKSNPGADSSNGRKIFYKPVVVNIGAPHIYFGTGDREHPLNLSTVDRLYCVIDWKNSAQDPANLTKTYPLVEGDLEDMTLNPIQDVNTTPAEADLWRRRLYSSPGAPRNPFNVTDTPYTNGWYIKLDGTDRVSGGDLGEKMLAPATVFDGDVFFSTYQIYTGARAGCEAGNLGISRLYHLDYKTAEAVMNYDDGNDLSASDTLPGNDRAIGATKEDGGSELLQRTDRVRTLGEGIPSGIVTIIDASGNVTQLISSSDKVESSEMKDVKLITPVYWMQW